MKDNLSITGVAEIVLSVRDLPSMRKFYCDVLGFELLAEACHDQGDEPTPNGRPTISFLTIKPLDTPLGRRHPQVLVLIDYQRHVYAKERFTGHDVRKSTLNHLAFEIPPESYEAHKERLERLDLAPSVSVFPGMAAKALFFNDPEGNLLELICHDESAATTD